MSADQQQLEYIEKKIFKKANKLRLKLPEAFQESNQAEIKRIREVKALHDLVATNPAFEFFRNKKRNKKIIEELESLGGIRQTFRSGMKSKGIPVDADSPESLPAHSPEASSALAPATISPAAEASFSAAASTGGAGSKRKREDTEQQEALSELEDLFCGKVCTAFWMLPAADARGMRSRKKPKRLSPHEDSRERGAAATTYNETRETREITDDDLVISHG
jgi:hypothetical protein